jgi:hypothetical protein
VRGDGECYSMGKRASDGFEHGFLPLRHVFDWPQKCDWRWRNMYARKYFRCARCPRTL